MPQKRMAARGQSAKLAKGPSPKKAPVAKPLKVEKSKKANLAAPAVKGKLSAKSDGKSAAKDEVKPVKATRPQAQIEKAKAALKKATASSAVAIVKAKPELKPVKADGKARGRKISIDISPGEAASALSIKWAALYKKAEQIEAKPYNMKAIFEEKTAIVHKVLGWGYILANRNDRLEVLFKDGIKYLISNYKP